MAVAFALAVARAAEAGHHRSRIPGPETGDFIRVLDGRKAVQHEDHGVFFLHVTRIDVDVRVGSITGKQNPGSGGGTVGAGTVQDHAPEHHDGGGGGQRRQPAHPGAFGRPGGRNRTGRRLRHGSAGSGRVQAAGQLVHEQFGDLLESAAFLNGRMREIRDSGKIVGLDRIAVMAALNIANDLLKLRTRGQGAQAEVGQRLKIMRERVESALEKGQQLEL